MKELERRALMGDRMAQKKYTILYEPLPCPCCGGKAGVCFDINAPEETPYCCSCFDCDLMVYGKTSKEVLEIWNRRPALPIGHCKDCANSAPRIVMGGKTKGTVCKIDPYLVHEVNPYGYCDCFKPKEEEAK